MTIMVGKIFIIEIAPRIWFGEKNLKSDIMAATLAISTSARYPFTILSAIKIVSYSTLKTRTLKGDKYKCGTGNLPCKRLNITSSIIYYTGDLMETIITRVRKVGGSLMATIPKEKAKELNIGDNEEIEMRIKKRKRSFLGALKGIGPFTEEDRLDVRDNSD